MQRKPPELNEQEKRIRKRLTLRVAGLSLAVIPFASKLFSNAGPPAAPGSLPFLFDYGATVVGVMMFIASFLIFREPK